MSTKYAVVRFSPQPERTEHVNVALLFSGPRLVLRYDKDFPKLQCVAGAFSVKLLADYLDRLVRHVEHLELEDVPGAVGRLSSQFFVEPPRSLAKEPSESIVRALMKHHLHRPRRRSRATGERSPFVETKLSELLVSGLHVPERAFKKRARPRDFLSAAALEALGRDGFRIARVIDGSKDLVLLDGLNLEGAPDAVERAAVEINYAFFRMRRIAAQIRGIEGRELHLATATFGAQVALPHRTEHALDLVRKHGAEVFPSDQVPRALAETIRRAAGSIAIWDS